MWESLAGNDRSGFTRGVCVRGCKCVRACKRVCVCVCVCVRVCARARREGVAGGGREEMRVTKLPSRGRLPAVYITQVCSPRAHTSCKVLSPKAVSAGAGKASPEP